jgi:predicted Zn-dependent peptidase
VPDPSCEVSFGAGARRRAVTDRHANLPLVAFVFTLPARDHADAPALQLLGSILGDGESSRFNRRLVRQERAALGAGGFTNLRRMSSVGLYFAVANQGVSAERLEELLAEEVERVLREGVTPAEVTKAQNQYRAQAIHQRQTTMGVAETLQGALRYFGDLEAANRDVERFLAVTAQDIRRVAQTYLTGDNRLTVVVNPPAREGQ